jgi:hypothetical protein
MSDSCFNPEAKSCWSYRFVSVKTCPQTGSTYEYIFLKNIIAKKNGAVIAISGAALSIFIRIDYMR